MPARTSPRPGIEADYAIDPKANAGSRDNEGFVEHDFKPFQALVAQQPPASATPSDPLVWAA